MITKYEKPPEGAGWSGNKRVPAIGDIIGLWVSQTMIPVRVISYFTELTKEECDAHNWDWWFGVMTTPLVLPPKLENLGYGQRIKELYLEKGPRALFDMAYEPRPFYQYGLEVADAPASPGEWYVQYGLNAEHELAVIAAIVLGGKRWEDELSISAWHYGAWHSTAYPELMGLLQTVRNTAHWKYVEHVAEKHAAFIKRLK